jgi:DNA-binding LacI/PurR family transcriptional regulator
VQSAIAELNFWPSQVARTLKSGVTRSVGVVVPDVTNPFFAAVVKGVESVSRQLALNIFLSNTDESVELECALLHELVGRVDGVILAPAKEASDNTHGLRRAGVPIVLLDRQLTARTELDCVLIDNEGGAARAVEHLVELGHERIGYVAACEAAGLELEPELTQLGDFKRESGYQATLRLLGLPRPPTAIFAANNLMSIGALQALHHMGVRVPQQLSFIGFDDLELGELLSPPLTAVSRPMVEQGVLAMRLLSNRIERTSDPEPRNIVLETRLVTRRSCAPPPSVDRAHRSSAGPDPYPPGKDAS